MADAPVLWRLLSPNGRYVLRSEAERKLGEEADEIARLRAAIEEYVLWEPGRRGHAAAHRRLREALNGGAR